MPAGGVGSGGRWAGDMGDGSERVRRNNEEGHRPRVVALAGWLFADLVLVIGLVLGFDGSGGSTVPTTTTTSTTALPTGIETTPICFRFEGVPTGPLSAGVVDGPELGALPGQIAAFLRDTGIESREVGLVLTFGHGPEGSAALQAQREVADGFNAMTSHRFSPFAGALTKFFSYSDGRAGVVTGELYLDAAHGPAVDPHAGPYTPDGGADCHTSS